MTVLAELEGHPFDLAALARHFPTGDPRIVVVDDRTYLETSALDDLFNNSGGLVATAGEILKRLNGYAVLDDPSYRPVRLLSRFLPGPDATTVQHVVGDEARAQEHVVVVEVAAEIRLGALVAGTAVNGVPLAPPDPDGPRLLALANSDLDDLLSIVGESGHLTPIFAPGGSTLAAGQDQSSWWRRRSCAARMFPAGAARCDACDWGGYRCPS